MSARTSEISAPESAGTEPDFFYVLLVGGLLAATGLVIAGGGLWLAALGATFHYAIAGLGLLLSGCLILKRQSLGVLVYGGTWALMLAHGLAAEETMVAAEILAPTAMMLLVLFTLPELSGWHERQRWSGKGYAAGFATLTATGCAALFLHAASVPPSEGYHGEGAALQALTGATPANPSPAGNGNVVPVPERDRAVPDSPRIMEAGAKRGDAGFTIEI